MDDLEVFKIVVSSSPRDIVLRSAYSDMLEEMGDSEEAFAQQKIIELLTTTEVEPDEIWTRNRMRDFLSQGNKFSRLVTIFNCPMVKVLIYSYRAPTKIGFKIKGKFFLNYLDGENSTDVLYYRKSSGGGHMRRSVQINWVTPRNKSYPYGSH